MKQIVILLLSFICLQAAAQTDSIRPQKPLKIKHAEPLYIDLIRDLGARRGEKEWNVGYSFERRKPYTASTAFVEYEFSPLNRLGLEVEMPVTLYQPVQENKSADVPRSRMEGLKLAAQYTFLVSEKYQMSMAAGYIHEFLGHSFQSIGQGSGVLKGHGMNPFLVVAKRWGKRFHSMIYTGPSWERTEDESTTEFGYQINASVHYVLPKGHFAGVEMNEEILAGRRDIVVRPQVKWAVAPRLSVGFLTGIPVHSHTHGLSGMIRVIMEP